MKAIVYHNYGSPDALALEEIEKPTAKDDEVLIKVHATAVTPFDWHFLTGTPYIARIMAGLLKPKHKVLGTDVAGRVEAVGVNARQFQPGDEVFGHSGNHGGFAEYVCVPEAELMLKPASMSFEEAAAIPLGAVTALVCLCDLGQKVGAEGFDQRCIWRRGYACGADRQVVWGRGDRCVQHQESGAGALAGRRPGH